MGDIQQVIKEEVLEKRKKSLLLITKLEKSLKHPDIFYRLMGDMQVLVEYGKNAPNLGHRFRVHAMIKFLTKLGINGILKITPGIRSFLVRYNPFSLSIESLIEKLQEAEESLGNIEDYNVSSRIVRLPIAYNHSLINKVISHYIKTTKATGPHLPDNLGFIAKCNGVFGEEDLIKKHSSTDYMVVGGGENMPGAICGFSLDPRVQFVVPKYNPIRTWTPEGSVGLGGPFLRIYPVDSPGGSQLMGRTIPILGLDDESKKYTSILKPFDRIKFFEVEEKEIESLREDSRVGNYKPEIEEGEFNLSDYQEFLDSVKEEAINQKREQKEFFRVWTKTY